MSSPSTTTATTTTPQRHQQHQLAAASSGTHDHHQHTTAAASSSSVEKSHSSPLQLSSAGHQQAVTLATFVNTHDHDNCCDVTVTEDDQPQSTRREQEAKSSSSHSASGSRKALPSGSTTLSTTPSNASGRNQLVHLHSNSITSAHHNRSTHSNETSVFARSTSMLLLEHITSSAEGKPLGAESSPYSALSPGYKTPKQFLQHTPPEKGRTEGIKEINVLKKKHEEHLMTLAPIVTDILVGAIMDQNSPEGAFRNTSNNNGRNSEPRLPGAVALSDDDDNCYTVRDDDEEQERPIPPSALESQPVYRQYETPGINSKKTLFLYIQYLLVESWASTASFVASLILIDRFLAKMCGAGSARVNATAEADRHRKSLLESSITSIDDEHDVENTKLQHPTKTSPPPFRLTFLNAFKLFVAASRIATKVVEMRVCDNRAFAKAARITTNSVSLIEARFLNDMDFEVCVLKSDWDIYAKKILAHI